MLDTVPGWDDETSQSTKIKVPGQQPAADMGTPTTGLATAADSANAALGQQNQAALASGGTPSWEMPGATDPRAGLVQQTGAAGTGASTGAASPAPSQFAPPSTDKSQNPQDSWWSADKGWQKNDYNAHVANVQNAATPQEAAVAHDTLARTLATDLTNDGHEVSWEGAQLIVDGRPYEVAGSGASSTGLQHPTFSSQAATDSPDSPWTDPTDPNTPPPTSAPPPAGTTPNPPHGSGQPTPEEVQKLLDDYVKSTTPTSPVAAALQPDGSLNHEWIRSFITNNFGNGVNKPTSASIDNIIQSLAHIGVHAVRATHAGGIPSDDKIVFDDGTMFDLISDVGGANAAWTYSQVGGGSSSGGTGGAPLGPAPSALSADPYQVADYSLPGWGETEQLAKRPAPVEVPPSAPPPNYEAMWNSTSPAYTPGSIGEANLPGYNDTLADAGSYTPGAPLGDVQGGDYKAGSLGAADLPWDYNSLMQELKSGNPVEGNTDSLINRILQHPESMDPNTVAQLKAASDEEAGQAALSEDAATKRFGFGAGLADSPWLASERAATARSADASQIASRRNIDITAAATNQADRLKAASLGASYQGQRAGQKQAAVSTAGGLALSKAGEERSRFGATEQAKQAQAGTEIAKAGAQTSRFSATEQTRQAAAASRQQAVSLAVDTAFKAAAEGKDRFALNESLKQAATKLGIDQDTLTQNYVVNTLADLTKRYGIDVGANIDLARLKEQSREFQSDLLVKIQQMKVTVAQWQKQMDQRDREFGSTLGLNYDQLNSDNMNKWWAAAGSGGA